MKILVPFDLTPVSERAVKFALDEYSKDESATLYAIHFNREKHETVEDIIRKTVESFADERDFKSENLVIRVEKPDKPVKKPDSVGEVILEKQESQDIDHIVMGQHNKSWFKTLVQGSASDKVAEKASVPVTLVP